MILDTDEKMEELDMPILQDDMEADEHMQKIRYWQDYETKMVDHFERQIELVREKTKSRIEWHKHLLQNYFARVPHNVTKTQESYPLRSGKLYLTKAKETLVKPEKDEEKQFLLYLAESGITGYTKTKIEESLDWKEYKKRLQIVDGKAVDKETGEIVDIQVAQVEPKFDFKLEEEENENGTEDQDA